MLNKYIPIVIDKIKRLSTRFGKRIRDVTRPKHIKHLCVVADLFRSKTESVAENALLRQQRIVLNRQVKKPIIIISELQMAKRLAEYCKYFGGARPHQGIGRKVPLGTHFCRDIDGDRIVSISVLGGLHYEYRTAA
jgi:hypothetical protein